MALLPATSVTVTVPVTPVPAVVITKGLAGELGLTPDRASVTV